MIVVDDGSTSENASSDQGQLLRSRVRVLRNEEARGAHGGTRASRRPGRSGRPWTTTIDGSRGSGMRRTPSFGNRGSRPSLVVVAGSDRANGAEPPKVVPLVGSGALRTAPGRCSIACGSRRSSNAYVVPNGPHAGCGATTNGSCAGGHSDMPDPPREGSAGSRGTDRIAVHVDRGHELAATRVGRDWARKVEGIRLPARQGVRRAFARRAPAAIALPARARNLAAPGGRSVGRGPHVLGGSC